MSNAIQTEIYPLTLERVGGVELQTRFEEAVKTVAEEMQATGIRQSNGKIKARITLTLEVTMDAETGSTSLLAGIDVKLPKAPKIGSPAMIRGGGIYVEPEDERQLDLIVHPTTGATRAQGA